MLPSSATSTLARSGLGQRTVKIMSKSADVESVEIEKILIDLNGPYTISYAFSVGKIVTSVKEVGVLNPPILTPAPDNRFHIVCGLKRVIACDILGLKKINAAIINNLTPKEMLLLNFYENLSIRDFNLIEQAMFIQRLCLLIGENNAVDFLYLFKIKPEQKSIEYFKWLLQLPDEYKIKIAHGEFSSKFLNILRQLEPIDHELLLAICSELRLSKSYQEEVITIMRDFALIEGEPFSRLPLAEDIKKIVMKTDPNPKKLKELLEVLRTHRNPRFSKVKKSFEELKNKIEFDSDIHLETNPYFEDDHYTLRIKFMDSSDLAEKLRKLTEKINSQIVPNITDFCFQELENFDK